MKHSLKSLPATQYGQRKCALFTCPQAEHLFNAVTSFIPFPAICLCLFFICEVFFFGTALSTDSHIPSSNPGTLSCMAEGIANAREGNSGCESCREYNVVYLEALAMVGVENRGRKEDRIDDVVV